jgi:hypothetical protein
MSEPSCISFLDAKNKMRTIGDEEEHVEHFLLLLADRLPDEGYASAVFLAVTLLSVDIARNKNGLRNGEPMPKRLTELPAVMQLLMPDLVLTRMDRFFPKEFADEIKTLHKRVIDGEAEMRARRA